MDVDSLISGRDAKPTVCAQIRLERVGKINPQVTLTTGGNIALDLMGNDIIMTLEQAEELFSTLELYLYDESYEELDSKYIYLSLENEELKERLRILEE